LLIVNSNELNQKDQKEKKQKKSTYCQCLLHNTTTQEEGDNLVSNTFFAAKPQKKQK
jgi:hypothetical protein